MFLFIFDNSCYYQVYRKVYIPHTLRVSMERLGNKQEERKQADKNLTLILNPVSALTKKHDRIAKEISNILRGEK